MVLFVLYMKPEGYSMKSTNHIDLHTLLSMLQELQKDPADKERMGNCLSLVKEALENTLDCSDEIDFRYIVDQLPIGLGIVRGDGYYLYCNKAYTEETGVQPEFVLNRYVQDIAKEGIYFKNPCSLKVLNTGRKISTVSTDNAYGEHKMAFTVGVPLFDDEGDIRYVVTSMLNTEIMRDYYEEFRNSQKQIESVRFFDGTKTPGNSAMVGSNSSITNIRRLVEKAAPTDATILIVGESGVGKELVADLVYENSKRKGKPYVKINCAAIPENLLESELFGYEKGSFTGASSKGKTGLLEMADGGTVLLDEIGELPLDLQPKLLRFLQQGTIYRIGSNTAKKLDVRIIAATNAKLKEKVAESKFRDDLYYRLSVFPISVPPLRMRVDDIRNIADYYFQFYCAKYDKTVSVPEAVYRAFESYNWPGNIRELQNIIEYLVICTDNGEEIEAFLLQTMFSQDQPEPNGYNTMSLYEMRCRFERDAICSVLKHSASLREAAKTLDIAASSLLRKTQKYGIDVPKLLKK